MELGGEIRGNTFDWGQLLISGLEDDDDRACTRGSLGTGTVNPSGVWTK